MKALISSVFIVLASAGISAPGIVQAAGAAQTPWVAAVVKRVDKPNGRVVLTHGDLPNGMPAMTMPFGVKDATWLDKMTPGQKIRFTIPANGELTVASFEAVK